ncbi:cytochrome c3 family protein [Desulfosarcina widdelii]|uniref:cytochrome c3 family protein n=1 Tax=Desulfosarcina widdelii TaxID=947919 RepID=UPI0012D32BF6|nr:cytochrome c3 family protein [Desulfosarcina widdelii]
MTLKRMIANINNGFYIVMLCGLISLLASSIVFGQEDDLLLNNTDAYPIVQRASVYFPHDLHTDSFDCLYCHHDYLDGQNNLDTDELYEGNSAIRCRACHDKGLKNELKRAYHKQCLGCHRESRIKGVPSGPELCGECHIKKNQSIPH